MGERGLGGYQSMVPIRCRGALHFYSARDAEADRLCVVAMAPRIPVQEARERLANLARLHRLVAGPHVPAVAGESLAGPAPWVALDCDAIADQESTVEFVRQGGDKPLYELGASLGLTIMQTLAACHRVRDPETGGSVCLGSLSGSNVLLSADGKIWLVGFGAGPLSDACIAPEVGFGTPPTPGADVYAIMLFMRAQIGFVELPEPLKRVFTGRAIDRDAELVRLFLWSNSHILGAAPDERTDMDTALANARSMWRVLGFEPDVAGFAAWIARALAAGPERLADAAPHPELPCIRLGPDGEWLETPNGMRHTLGTRRPLRRLLVALAEAHRDRTGAALTVEELLQAGWPGEDPLPEAGSNRVYVAISTLRKLGLGELLQRWDGGYRLDPTVHCQL